MDNGLNDEKLEDRCIKIINKIYEQDQQNDYKTLRIQDAVNYCKMTKNSAQFLEKYYKSGEVLNFYDL
jgi:hypothetical protein